MYHKIDTALLQWPSLMAAPSGSLTGMPAMVLERFAACQTVASVSFCVANPTQSNSVKLNVP